MVKYIAILLLLALSFTIACSAEASLCRTTNDHLICILSIKRSAKNYWEYRAAISVDGVERPIEVYNCRDRRKVRTDGAVVPFAVNGPGELICSFFQR